ncbi:hypothetical protein [Microvirga calopogonii]|uniref:hypothetical protein n=1 Tax=Microvirga calopogonii TaxID=2078013 RepID=UPI000E0CDA0F|nr:hypothetical protein [Microvirga calopogonii]
MNSPDLAADSNIAPPYWVIEKVELAQARGYGFCLIYVEPENHDNLCTELNQYDLAGLNIRLFPARSPDFVRLAEGAPDHMPVMLKWADPIVIERDAPAKKPKGSKKAKKATKAAERTRSGSARTP